MNARNLLAAGTLALLLLAGCGSDGPEIYRLAGTVTLEGQPVPSGRITFTPDLSKGNSGGAGYAEIVDGKFDTATETGRGVIGGPHKISFTCYDGKSTNTGADETAAVESSIKATVVGYEIESDLAAASATDLKYDLPASARLSENNPAAPTTRNLD